MKVALLTGGKDPHYARGLGRALAGEGVHVAMVGGPQEMVVVETGPGRVVLHDLVAVPGSARRRDGEAFLAVGRACHPQPGAIGHLGIVDQGADHMRRVVSELEHQCS